MPEKRPKRDSISISLIPSIRVFWLIATLAFTFSGTTDVALGELVAESDKTTNFIEPEARGDLSKLNSAVWQTAIAKATSYPPLAAGHGKITLLRVLFEDEDSSQFKQPDSPGKPTVNGIKLYIPGLAVDFKGSFTPGNPQRPAIGQGNTAQLTSTKLIGFSDFPNGGGMHREVHHGNFVMVEHINSTRRKGDKDPVKIESFFYRDTQIWVPVPPSGELGIFGDIVLRRTPSHQRGRIVAEIVGSPGSNIKLGTLRVGSKEGGNLSLNYKFSDQGLAASDLLSSGEYTIIIPAFGIAKSRWDAVVEPNKVTYLRFTADSQQQLQLAGKQTLEFPAVANGIEQRR